MLSKTAQQAFKKGSADFKTVIITEGLCEASQHDAWAPFMCMLLYLCDQQVNVLFKGVQESLQSAGVGSAALSSPNFRQPSMFVVNLGQNLERKKGEKEKD